jgi:hypothetical protein
VAKVSITLEQFVVMERQLQAAKDGKRRFLDVVMPNGKPLAECTGDDVDEMCEALEKMGQRLISRQLLSVGRSRS